MDSNVVVSVNNNVQVRVIDHNGKTLRLSQAHNKATNNLVDGLLRFLRGDFHTTSYNSQATPTDAAIYIPVRANFGRIGVKITESTDPANRRFDYIDKDEFAAPTFDSYELQEPIDFTDHTILTFQKIRQVGYTDNNNAECLEFSLYINPGKLVGYLEDQGIDGQVFIPYDWTYYNPFTGEYEVMLTEVGLVSDSDVLLARVLFNGEVDSKEYINASGQNQGSYPIYVNPDDERNPITQSESTTVILTWRIGIVSVGPDDEFVTQTSLTTDQFVVELSDWMREYITTVTGVESENWKPQYTEAQVNRDIQSKTAEILNGVSVADLK